MKEAYPHLARPHSNSALILLNTLFILIWPWGVSVTSYPKVAAAFARIALSNAGPSPGKNAFTPSLLYGFDRGAHS